MLTNIHLHTLYCSHKSSGFQHGLRVSGRMMLTDFNSEDQP